MDGNSRLEAVAQRPMVSWQVGDRGIIFCRLQSDADMSILIASVADCVDCGKKVVMVINPMECIWYYERVTDLKGLFCRLQWLVNATDGSSDSL